MPIVVCCLKMDQHKKRRRRRWALQFRRDRFLTLLGSLIIFVTFIVKEGIGENLKDLVSSIETAQNVFAIREAIVYSADKTSQSSAPTLQDVKGRIEALRKQAMATLDGGEDLAQAVGRDYVLFMEQQLNETAVEFSKISEGANSLKESGRQTPAAAKALNDRASKAAEKAQEARTSVVVKARTLRDRKKYYYCEAKWASYILFTFGWILTIYGQLSGRAIPSSESKPG